MITRPMDAMNIMVILLLISFESLISLKLYVNDLNGERKKEVKKIGALDSLVLLGWVLPLLDL